MERAAGNREDGRVREPSGPAEPLGADGPGRASNGPAGSHGADGQQAPGAPSGGAGGNAAASGAGASRAASCAVPLRTLPDGARISALGLGCMRFPGFATGHPQARAADAIIARAVERGVNYLDTAWLYPGNEACVGASLERLGLRDRVMLATKLPHSSCASAADFDRYFDESLARLRTDRVEFYLVHNVTSIAQWERLVNLGFPAWVARRRAAGRLARIGFSYHGAAGDFARLLDAYDWDFCQIQYNYAGEHTQAGTAGLHAAAKRGVAVFVMEPLLGGRLADKLPAAAKRVFAQADARAGRAPRTPAAWGLAWLWDKPEVSMVLSGMTSPAMVDENCDVAAQAAPGSLSADERVEIAQVVELFDRANRVDCTGCGYCLPCPRGVNIPGCFSAYNASFAHGRLSGMQQYFTASALRSGHPSLASLCVHCGACERRCPQHIAIPDRLDDVRRRFQPGPITPLLNRMARKAE